MMIDQNETVGQMVQRLHSMSGLNLLSKVTTTDGKEVELTKIIIYDLKDSRRQKITTLLEEHRTLEELQIIDKQILVATEVLTEAAKQLIQRYYTNEEPENVADQVNQRNT